MLKLSLKQGQYVNIGDDIRVVYVGGSGGQGRLMIDAPKEVPIVRKSGEKKRHLLSGKEDFCKSTEGDRTDSLE